MRDRKKRNIVIASLCCLLVFMGIGYALLTQILTINGTATLTGSWNIYIQSMSLRSKSATAESLKAELDANEPTKASFDLTLLKPGDYVEYDVVVKNEGTVNAVLRKLEPTINSGNMDTLLTHTMIQGQILKAGETTEFTLKIRFDERATKLPQTDEERLTTYEIQLIYEQYDGDVENIDTTIVPVTANDCFSIDDKGVITDYDYSCGTYVTVPAVVNDTTVTEIGVTAFTNANTITYMSGYNPAAIVVDDEDTYALAVQYLKSEMGATDEMITQLLFISGSEPTDQLSAYTPVAYRLTSNGLETPISSVEYLDLSQVDGLMKIASGAFASAVDVQSLKYLNIDGVDPSVVEQAAFDYASLDSLTIDIDLYNIIKSKTNATINKLRIYPGENSTEIPDSKGVGDGSSSKIVVNNLIIEEGITRIGNFAFYGNEQKTESSGSWNIKSVELPESLLEIGASSFGKSPMTNIELPSKLKTIENRAFYNSGLTALHIPSSVEVIGDSAFNSSNNIISLTFGNNSRLVSIGDDAFRATNISNEVEFPSNIKSIGANAFEGCKISGRLLLENVQEIGNNAFIRNNFEEVFLNNVTTIGDYAFDYNLNLNKVWINRETLGSGNTETIGKYAFSNGMIKDFYATNIDTIGSNAFANNKIGYESIGDPFWDLKNVKHIGDNAFNGNPLGREGGVLLVLCGVETIGDYAFKGTGTSFTNIAVSNDAVTYMGKAPTFEGTLIESERVYFYHRDVC